MGNHLEQKDDIIKQAMKRNLNRYFATPLGLPQGDYKPQVPCFGFLLRSAIVKAFPGLEVSAPFADTSSRRQEAILIERLEEDVLLCLFDRMPGSKYWHPVDGLSLCSPPHQPCFRLGEELTCDETTGGKLVVHMKPLYTTQDKLPYEEQGRSVRSTDPEYRWRPLKPVTYTSLKGVDGHNYDQSLPKRVFDFYSRMLVLPAYGTLCLEFLKKEVNKDRAKIYFQDDTPTAALVGLQLNASIPALMITTPKVDNPSYPLDTIDTVRQIRLPAPSSESVVAPTQQVETHAPQPESHGILPQDVEKVVEKVLLKARPVVVDDDVDDESLLKTGYPILDWLSTKAEYHLRRRRQVQALSRPYITPPKLLRPDFLHKMVGWIEDVVTEAEGGQVPLQDYIPSQYTTTVSMDGEGDLGKFEDGNLPPVDLTFSIVFRDFTGATQELKDKLWDKPELQLFSLQVDIPLGSGPNNMSAAYNGNNVKMVHNQLFTIHQEDVSDEERRAKSDPDGHFVRFTLIPRTTTRSISLSKCGDMSFTVNQIVPNTKEGKCSFFITEDYRARWIKNPGAGNTATPAPPTQNTDATAAQLFWTQHQAAHSTNLKWGSKGWKDLLGELFGEIIGISLLVGAILAIILGVTFGVPLLVIILRIVQFFIPSLTTTWIVLWYTLPFVIGILKILALLDLKTPPEQEGTIWSRALDLIQKSNAYLLPALAAWFSTELGHHIISWIINSVLWVPRQWLNSVLADVSQWLLKYLKFIEIGVSIVYLIIWYRTSNRIQFYTMALIAFLVLIGIILGRLTNWLWNIIFGK